MIKRTDENNKNIWFEYDNLNRLKSIKNNSEQLMVGYDYYYSANAGNNWTFDASNPNYIETTVYNDNLASNNSISKMFFDGLGRSIQNQFLTHSTGSAIVQNSRYDALGRMFETTNPIYQQTGTGLSYEANLSGYDGLTRQFYYNDPLGRVKKTEFEGTDLTTPYPGVNYGYGINGSNEPYPGAVAGNYVRTIVTDEEGRITKSYQDGFGNKIADVIDMGNDPDLVTRNEYDLLGNLTKVIDPKSMETIYHYDKLGRLTETNNPDVDESTHYWYDKSGNLRFVRNAGHKTTQSFISGHGYYGQYSSFNRTLLKTTDIVLSGEVYPNNVANFVFIITDNNGAEIVRKDFNFSQSGYIHFQATLSPGTYTFDLSLVNGTLYDDLEAYFYSPQFQYYKYDHLNRVIEEGVYYGSTLSQANLDNKNFPTSNRRILIKRKYDTASTGSNQKGRLAEVEYLDQLTDEWGKTTYSYTNEGQVQWVMQQIPGLANKRIDYNYSRSGQVTLMKINNYWNNTWTGHRYIYDRAGRLSRLQDDMEGDSYAYYTYNARNQIRVLILGSSAQRVDYDYTSRGWLRQINDPANLSKSGYPNNRFAMDLAYRDNGNVSEINWRTTNSLQNDTPQYTFTYDLANRLSEANFTTSNANDVRELLYGYDENGNFQTINRTTSPLPSNSYGFTLQSNTNRIQMIQKNSSNYAIHYDPNGNVISHAMRGINNTTYNSANQPIQVTSGDETVTYLYDGDGNRVKKTYSGGSILYYLRGADGQTLAVFDKSGNLVFVNILAGGSIIGKINP